MSKLVTPKLIVHNLGIEMTRDCNMACEICLRGNRQKMRMSMAYVERLLRHVDTIYEITFSGGEPSLNLQVIPKTIELTKKYGIPVSSFYVVTNGLENQEKLALELLKIYPDMEEPEVCGVSLSIDPFHDTNRQSKLVKGLAFYRDFKEHGTDFNDPEDDWKWVMSMGRAKDNGIGRTPDWIPTKFQAECTFNKDHPAIIDYIDVDELYLSCNGYCYPSCDLSYDLMDEYKILTPARLAKELMMEMMGQPSPALQRLHDGLEEGLY